MQRRKLNILVGVLKEIYLACFLGLSSTALCQDLYISTDQNALYRIENDYSLTYITTFIYPKTLTDIAFSSTGQLYGVASQDLVKIDLQTGEVNMLFHLLGGDYSNSLSCSNEDKLYLLGLASDVIYAYSLPDSSMQLINYIDHYGAHDLTFYKGNILFSSDYKHKIDAYDVQLMTINHLACQPSGSQINGISNVMDSCGSEHIFVIDQDSRFYELNFAEHQLNQLYNYWIPDRKFLGMASLSEYLGSNCYTHLDPVECTNITAVSETSSNAHFEVYPNPATDFFKIQCEIPIDVVNIYSLSGELMKSIHQDFEQIDIHNLPGGIYFLQAYSGQKSFYQKILIL